MHELSLAEEIAAIVERHAQGRKVSAVTLTIGELAGVEIDSLCFFLKSALKDVAILIDRPTALARCPACGLKQRPEFRQAPCLACGARELEIRSGAEFKVSQIRFAEIHHV